MAKSNHYINNEKFCKALIEYKEECKKSIEAGGIDRPKSRNYEYIGQCFLLIATKITGMPSFCKYSYRDEMAGDAVIDCVLRMNNFDPKITRNAFAYFTALCYFSAVRRINAESKQRDIKIALLKNSPFLNDLIEHCEDEDASDVRNSIKSMLEYLEPVERKPLDPKLKKTTLAHQKRLKEQALKSGKEIEQPKVEPKKKKKRISKKLQKELKHQDEEIEKLEKTFIEEPINNYENSYDSGLDNFEE